MGRLLPLIPGTVALWQLQSDLKDTSGNALDLSPVDCVTNAPVAAPSFTNIANRNNGVVVNDACILGVNLDFGTTALRAPLSPLLQMVGAMTIQWTFVQKSTFTTTYFCCADPAGRSGGQGPDRIGSLYTLWSSSGNPDVSDQHIGSNLPVPGYGAFPGYNDHALFNWADNGRPITGDWHAHQFAAVRSSVGTWTVSRDGVSISTGIASAGTNVASGVERFFIGAYEHESSGTGAAGLFASVRVLNFARAASDLATDAFNANSPCGAYLNYRGAMLRMVG